MKTVVVFQGGGALGAFGCGAWQVLGPLLQRHGGVLALGGASIGAVNAAVVACALARPADPQADAGDAAAVPLQQLWQQGIATPSAPFVLPALWAWTGRPPQEAQRWNGLLTSLLLGNRVLHAPAYAHWHPLAALQRRRLPLFKRPQFAKVMQALVGDYRSDAAQRPLLCVAASHAKDGALRLFDSDTTPITVRHLEASTAIPMLYEPAEIDGQLYWDGEMNRRSMVAPMLRRLQALGRLQPAEALRLVTIEQITAPQGVPDAGPALSDMGLAMLQAGKLGPDEVAWPGPLQWVRVRRQATPEDGISGQFDASPERIAELVAAGMQAARLAWAAPQALQPAALHHAPAERALP